MRLMMWLALKKFKLPVVFIVGLCTILCFSLNSRRTEVPDRPAIPEIVGGPLRHYCNLQSKGTFKVVDELSTNSSMQPLNSVAFVKTFKTGSSTLAGILASINCPGRQSVPTGLVQKVWETKCTGKFSINCPSGTGTVYTEYGIFATVCTATPVPPGFHILNNHAIFNKSGFQEVMRPETKYITLLRDPIKTFYSLIAYFHLLKHYNFTGDIFSPDFPMKSFLDIVSITHTHRTGLIHIGQMFSLGFDTYTQSNDEDAVAKKIRELDLELDLVLMNEYFDESLIILKNMMCWQFEDILYVSQKISGRKYNFPEEHVDLLRNWTAADSALYDHFNHTLWTKVQAYGSTFTSDLTYFRLLNQNVNNICSQKVISTHGLEQPLPNLRAQNGNWTKLCIDIKRACYPYTVLIRENLKHGMSG